ncbi:hypothetical protein OEZ86_006734 [Tetradesmus obliquus]|nr:hypothetical protein OEZ86_006734 [Tetradesmus obliquus]
MSQHVVESGGLAVLQALLPEPPAPPPTAEELAAFMSSSGGIADTVDGLKLPPKLAASKQATPRGASQVGDKTPAQATPRSATPADGVKQPTPRAATPADSTQQGTPCTADGSVGQASQQGTQEAGAAAGFQMPAVKTSVPEIQAHVLRVIAAVLSQLGVVQSLLLQEPPANASLVRQLLHMFAPAVLPLQHSAAHDRPDGAQGAADAAMPGGGARAPSPQKGAAGSTAAKPAAAAGTKKPGAATGSPHEQGASGAGATTPRKGAAASSSGAKEAKAVAQCGLAQQASVHAHQAIARALLLMPEEAFVPPARPPLPSPPATPPAPPLPTSQFAWDALGRPYITDGAVVLSSA